MQSVSELPTPVSTGVLAAHTSTTHEPHNVNVLAHYQIIRRNGGVVPFEPNKIAVAMMKAFLA
ncbi:MAG: hypothetical protein CFE44_13185, partial [Burkholderiales bacterium PBB4]